MSVANNLTAASQPVVFDDLSAQVIPLVLLHGWGSDQRCWAPLLPYLDSSVEVIIIDLPGFGSEPQCNNMDDYLNGLAKRLPPHFMLLGWSLGGMLATRFAARFPGRVKALITLATNLSFITRADWPEAMDNRTFQQFVDSYDQDESLTLKRFASLMAKGETSEKSLIKSLRACSLQSRLQSAEPWQAGLHWLQQLDNRQAFATLEPPGLHLLAELDALVPVTVFPEMSSVNGGQTVEVVSSVGHAMHWSKPEEIAQRINQFVAQHSETLQISSAIDKRKVAQSFGKAAAKYDSVASLQRSIGETLLADVKPAAEGLCIDLGCGTGHCMPLLAQSQGQVLGLDLAEGMLSYARAKHDGGYSWLCADAENLPLASNTVNTVFSALAVQWCTNLSALFKELQRAVKREGRIYLATLGPKTLYELRQAWSQVDQYEHVNQFATEGEVRSAISSSNLELLSWRTEERVLHYREVRELTYELKTLGAHNMNQGQSSGLTGRERLEGFKQAYEQFRDREQRLPATYEVFYLELKVSSF